MATTSEDRVPAVHDEHRARGERRRVARQVDRGADQLLELAKGVGNARHFEDCFRVSEHDGSSPFGFDGVFWRLIMPLATPGLAVTSFYAFLTARGEVAFASAFLSAADESKTLAVGLQVGGAGAGGVGGPGSVPSCCPALGPSPEPGEVGSGTGTAWAGTGCAAAPGCGKVSVACAARSSGEPCERESAFSRSPWDP